MSDRHLYKAKRTDNGEWVEGYYTYYPDGMDDTEETKHVIRNTSINPGKLYYVDPSTICQCTGLKDKTGKLIWENDIIKRTDLHNAKEPSIGIIEYDVENTAFLIHWIDVVNYSATYPWEDKIEVSGSLIDNSSLLEGGEE